MSITQEAVIHRAQALKLRLLDLFLLGVARETINPALVQRSSHRVQDIAHMGLTRAMNPYIVRSREGECHSFHCFG
jgi:hypothetical protein